MKQPYDNVWRTDKRLYTRNLVPGEQVYGERLKEYNDQEYRQWDPNRSKLAAAIMQDLDELPIAPDSQVLYLGAASGTTPSHVSDIVRDGIVYGVEYAEQVVRDLLTLSEQRDNLAPILADARKPDRYSGLVDRVDTVFQDVAQPDQVELLQRNTERFLRPDGQALLALKARSISSSKDASKVFQEQEEKLRQHFTIEWSTRLDPYEEDHKFYRLTPD
ncbi:MAG: fibrillarin-like rRNA/tRNA 2'-O-methyltransferase [Candidatus Nanohaloarchaea archaeon]|nr:fibrillarin-like rRNA/tRNA 2'-O-methyltransferase [Candidatus Nanohaloarchaea archaeon]